MRSELKILVELTVKNPTTCEENDVIKERVESKINNPSLGEYLHSLGGCYADAEVVSIKYIEEHDTRAE